MQAIASVPLVEHGNNSGEWSINRLVPVGTEVNAIMPFMTELFVDLGPISELLSDSWAVLAEASEEFYCRILEWMKNHINKLVLKRYPITHLDLLEGLVKPLGFIGVPSRAGLLHVLFDSPLLEGLDVIKIFTLGNKVISVNLS